MNEISGSIPGGFEAGLRDLKSVPGTHSDRLEESAPQRSGFDNDSSLEH